MATERALTFSEPSIYASKDWVSVQRVQRPLAGPRWYTAGQRCNITLRNPGQNEVMDTDKARFLCGVTTFVEAPTTPMFKYYPSTIQPYAETDGLTGDAVLYPTYCRNAQTIGLPMRTASDAMCNLPGLPKFGFPFLSAVRVSIPGLSLQDFLTSEEDSPWQIASRLLCSGGVGSVSEKTGKLGFHIAGEAAAAGARSAESRAGAAWAACVSSDRVRWASGQTSLLFQNEYGAMVPPGGMNLYQSGPNGNSIDNPVNNPSPAFTGPAREGEVAYRGNLISYALPLSLFTFLFNSASNLLPLGLYSASPDTLSFSFEFASASTALVNVGVDRPDVCGLASYRIWDPKIMYTTVQINNVAIMASLEMLFRGLSSIPISPEVSAPLAMVMKYIDYYYATTRLEAPSGAFSLTLPGNQPSVRALLLRFCAENVKRAGHFTSSSSGNVNFNNGGVPFDWQNYVDEFNGLLPVNTSAVVKASRTATLPTLPRNFGMALSKNWTRDYDRAPGGPYDFYAANPRVLTSIPESDAWRHYSAGDGQWGGAYVLSAIPEISNLSAKIGSYRCPLDPLSDYRAPLNVPLAGFESITNSFARFADTLNFQLVDVPLDLIPPFVYSEVLGGDSFRLYKQARNDFSPFASREDPYDGPLEALLFYGSTRSDDARQQFVAGSSLIYPLGGEYTETNDGGNPRPPAELKDRGDFYEYVLCDGRGATRGGMGINTATTWFLDAATAAIGTIEDTRTRNAWACGGRQPYSLRLGNNRNKMILPECAGPNLLLLPLETIAPTYNHQDDAYACRGLDLRAIAGIEVTGRILGTSSGQVGYSFPGLGGMYYGRSDVADRLSTREKVSDEIEAQAWTIRAMVALDRMNILLPGRTDTEAQFSLISTGNTAIPSGGAPAM